MPMNYHDLTTIYNALTGSKVTTNEVEAIKQVPEQIQPVIEKTTVLVEQARDRISEPLNDLLTKVGKIAYKAAPTAFAASASLQYTGGVPSFASFLQPANLRSRYLRIGTNRSSRIGYPLEDFRILSSLSGFVLCESVRLDLAATATTPGATLEEQQLIKQYLEAGCYIE